MRARVLPLIALVTLLAPRAGLGQMILRTEHFDLDPAWDGHNNRAITPPPAQIIQNFGFRSTGTRAGGPAGEVGGTITPAGEAAYYAKSIPLKTFDDALFASGTLNIPAAGHTLLGFFNSATINEWRTPNTISLRLYGRETHFEAFADYGTSKWRAGGNVFPVSFVTGSAVHTWSLAYDPAGNGGGGSVTATIDDQTRITNLEAGHKLDGATFDRFGLLNVIKSYDNTGQFFIDNVNINGVTESFTSNPGWIAFNNVRGYTSTNVRPRFDFGYSPSTNHAGGANAGEIGGHTFRGDNRFAERMAYCGDQLEQTLTMNDPLHASGKVAFRRGVSDSTTLLGFFHSTDSVRVSTSQAAHAPENFIGVAIEGPSAEGFLFYASYGTDAEGIAPRERGVNPPYIYPDGTPHDWSLDYDPAANGGLGRITIALDGQLATLDLEAAHRAIGAHFDRFGMITTHVDGNGQTVYFDDLTYTIAIPEPTAPAAVLIGAIMLCLRRCRRLPLAAAVTPVLALLPLVPSKAAAQMITQTENFNIDPAWDGHNNRSTLFGPATVTQNYGYSSNRVGGTINPTGEISYFAQAVSNASFNTPLTASGTITNNGGGNSWLGFFNSATANEWRSANSLSLRIYGRGNHFLAYPEYGTSKWRAGADGFVSGGSEVQFPINTALNWSLNYNPTGNGGGGTITAIINGQTSVKNLDPGHKLDTATFNRFGLGAVNKSWDSPGQLFIDNVNVNGAGTQTFTGGASGWSGVNSNATYSTNNVRFRFDFGHSPTNNAGGAASGEAGGNFFRGDSRQAETMAFYGDQLAQTLTLNQPLHAHGKVSFHRGVTDSTVHLGFFHNTDSVRVSQAQGTSTPENFVGVTIEGPSAEGFFFYPSYNSNVEGEGSGGNRGIVTPPYIYPDGTSHNWAFDYNPNGNGGTGQIVISLDGQQGVMNLSAAHRGHGAQFNRFGFVTPHIDGNGQTVFIDDVTYTVGFGASQQWMPDASDDWHIASNWAGAAGAVAPNSIGAAAVFGNNNTAPRTVFINSPTTVGTLSFSSPTSWLLSGFGSLTMQVSSGTAQISVTQGTHKINLPLIIASNTSIALFGGSQLVVADPVTVNAGRTLTHSGTGSVVYQSTFTIGSGGSVIFDSAAQLESLAIAPDATAQVGGSLVVKRGDFGAIAGKVKQGFNGGDWRGGGITSPAAAEDAHGARAIGVVDNAVLRLSAFAGFDKLSGDEILLRETWSGDADLSGLVDVSDFDRFLLGFDDSNTTATWVTGDFDFSGAVDALDFEHFLLGLKYQPDPPITSDLLGALHAFVAREGLDVDLSSVPEPASIGLLALGAGALLQRSRRTT